MNADMMSRFPIEEKENYVNPDRLENKDINYSLQIATLPVSVEEIIAETDKDDILSTVKGYLKSGKWPAKVQEEVKPFVIRKDELTLENNVILWGFQVVIPNKLVQ